MIDPADVDAFLAEHRIAVIGASDDKQNFGRTIYRALRDHDHEVVAVNPAAAIVEGDRCYPDVASVPGDLGGAIVMVPRDKSAEVVGECIARGVPRIWLFKGAGGVGAVSDEAVALCHETGIPVIEGACPLMFLEPVAWFHRAHRGIRHLNHSLARAS